MAAGILTALLVAEVGLRLFDYESRIRYVHRIDYKRILAPFPGVRYVHPSYSVYTQAWPSNPRGYFDAADNTVQYRTNNLGFRGNDFALRRSDAVRIAFLGDSFCWGTGVRERDTFAALIEDSLNRRKPGDRTFEIYNFCLEGYESEGQAALYRNVVRHFRPDVLVVWFFLNDVNAEGGGEAVDWGHATGGDWLGRWRARSVALDALVAPLNGMANAARLRRDLLEAYSSGNRGRASVERHLQEIGRLGDEHGVQLFLTVLPWLTDLENGQYPFVEPHRVVRAIAEDAGFSVVDLRSPLARHRTPELWVHPVDHHPNELAHQVIASEVSRRLEQRVRLSDLRGGRKAELESDAELPELETGQDWTVAFGAVVGHEDPTPRPGTFGTTQPGPL